MEFFLFSVAYVAFCSVIAYVGRQRRIGFLGVFAVSLLLTPLVTALILLLGVAARSYTRARANRRIVGRFDAIERGQLCGWIAALDGDNPRTVEFLKGDTVIGTCVARLSRPDVVAYGVPVEYCGFGYPIPNDQSLKAGEAISVRDKQTQHNLKGSPQRLHSTYTSTPSEASLFSEMANREFVAYLYTALLHRPPDATDLDHWAKVLNNGVSRINVLEQVLTSAEFSSTNRPALLEDLSDSDFLQTMWNIILGDFCNADAQQLHLGLLAAGSTRLDLVGTLLRSEAFRSRVNRSGLPIRHASATAAWIMGTDTYLTPEEWNAKLLNVLIECARVAPAKPHTLSELPAADRDGLADLVSSTRTPIVSILTSLYKGRSYIEAFMDNITSQTIFERHCELIIIDANSPEGECDVIGPFMERYSNIKYIRTPEVIGIYAAWNLGLEHARGMLVTNANVDDLRSPRCLETQARCLLEHEEVDTVYQNFFYTLTPNLPFDVIAKCGVVSDVPFISRAALQRYNAPHNAPMWRRSLHDKIGVFDTHFTSAADYEFWHRAFSFGSKFWKIDEPLVAYYHNPSGISTSSETRGLQEAREIQSAYHKLYGHRNYIRNSKDFKQFCYDTFDLDQERREEQEQEAWPDRETFLYQCFTRQFATLTRGES